MQDTNVILDILYNRSRNNLMITKLYKLLYNIKFYKKYTNLSSLKTRKLIELLKTETYKYGTSISNKESDKAVKIIVTLILEDIFKSKILDSVQDSVSDSLCKIRQQGKACVFFLSIKLDYKICYKTLRNELEKVIKDQRFLNLLFSILKRDKYFNSFTNTETFSGVYKSNDKLFNLIYKIYVNILDKYINETFVSKFNFGKERLRSKYYNSVCRRIVDNSSRLKLNRHKLPKNKLIEKINYIKKLKGEFRNLNVREPIENDPTFRRLSYIRYYNEAFITFTGTFKEATFIKYSIDSFITNNLNMKNSTSTLKNSTNNKDPIRFLNYNLIVQWNNNRLTNGRKTLGGEIGFLIPNDIVKNLSSEYLIKNKPIHLNKLLNRDIYFIITFFQMKLRSIVQYYKFARNQNKLTNYKLILQTSLVKTLAYKFKTTCKKIYSKYNSTYIVDNKPYKVLSVIFNDKNIHFGAIPLKRYIALSTNKIIDDKNHYKIKMIDL